MTSGDADRGSSKDGRDDGQADRPPAIGPAAAALAAQTGAGLRSQRTLILTLAIGIALVALLAFAASRVYDAVTESDGVANLDLPILDTAMQARSPALDGFAAAIAYLLGPVGMPIIAVVCAVTLAISRRSITPVTLIVAGGLGSLAMTVVGKDIIGRSRPLLVDAIPPFEFSPSFPSGHTLNATVIFGLVAYLLLLRHRSTAPRIAIITITVLLAIVVGLSRVLLGAHWFTDVLAAWLLGAAWLAFIITAHRLHLTGRGRARDARSATRIAG